MNKVENLEIKNSNQMDDRYTDFTTMLNGGNDLILIIGVVVSQVIGVAMLLISGFWLGEYRGGFAWNAKLVFNYHPILMSIGLIFFFGNSLLVYRVFRNVTKIYIKILHVVLHAGALIFASVGLKAAFDSHNLPEPPILNLYSLHSWLGLSTVIIFGLQWVIGFVVFLFPKLSEGFRRFFLPHHKFWGLAIFGLSCATALLGITEKFFFVNKTITTITGEMVLINFYGISIVLYAIIVVFLVTKSEYARVN